MSNNRKHRENMRQVYMIRRIVAVLVIVLVLVMIFTQCINKRDKDKTTSDSNNTQVVTVQPNTPAQPDNNATTDNNENSDTNEDPLETALSSNLDKLNEDYKDTAKVTFDKTVNRFYFELENDAKKLVTERETNEGFKEFWDKFVYDLTKTSETLADSVQPGLELHVTDPSDEQSTILIIKDGSTIFDSTKPAN